MQCTFGEDVSGVQSEVDKKVAYYYDNFDRKVKSMGWENDPKAILDRVILYLDIFANQADKKVSEGPQNYDDVDFKQMQNRYAIAKSANKWMNDHLATEYNLQAKFPDRVKKIAVLQERIKKALSTMLPWNPMVGTMKYLREMAKAGNIDYRMQYVPDLQQHWAQHKMQQIETGAITSPSDTLLKRLGLPPKAKWESIREEQQIAENQPIIGKYVGPRITPTSTPAPAPTAAPTAAPVKKDNTAMKIGAAAAAGLIAFLALRG